MKKNILQIIIALLTTVFAFASCTDVWDEHYSNAVTVNKNNQTLTEYINSRPDLSTFASMLRVSGYDSILSKSQTYTVWAPADAALQQVDLKDTLTVTNLVKNHVSRFAYPTSVVDQQMVYMLDKKNVLFSKGSTGYTFGGKTVKTDSSDIAVKNGILHTINGFVPYKLNIWEYITTAPGLDSLRNYLNGQSIYKFDPDKSVEIGTNKYGQSVYDSVIVFSNPILDKIGAVNDEDSVFTALLPNNAGWAKAFNRIKSGYKTYGLGAADSTRKYTQNALVQNLMFKTSLADTTGIASLTSTTGAVISKPGYLFTGSQRSELSNGYVYVTDSLRYKAADTYQRPIVVEAENSTYGRSYSTAFATLNVQTSLGTAFTGQVSNDKYLVVVPTTPNDVDTVTFPIPNTLSGKYRIYCVFVPTNISDATTAKTNKVKFFFSYMDSQANAPKQVKDAAIIVGNKIATTATATAATFTTKANQITKMLVTEYTFPYCNLYNPAMPTSSITTRLKVVNASKIVDEIKGFSDRTMRIDCIVLEAVQ